MGLYWVRYNSCTLPTQVLMDGTNSPPYLVLDVGSGLSSPSVARDMAPDPALEHLYILTGPRVSTNHL